MKSQSSQPGPGFRGTLLLLTPEGSPTWAGTCSRESGVTASSTGCLPPEPTVFTVLRPCLEDFPARRDMKQLSLDAALTRREVLLGTATSVSKSLLQQVPEDSRAVSQGPRLWILDKGRPNSLSQGPWRPGLTLPN